MGAVCPGASGGRPMAAPICGPTLYQTTMHTIVHSAADVKKIFGLGKKE